MKQKQIVVALGLLVNDNKQVLISLRNDPKQQDAHNRWEIILIGHICKTQDTPHPANEEVAGIRWVGPDEIDRLDYLPECDVFVKKASEYISSR